MKKFRFSMQAVYDVKSAKERQIKGEYAALKKTENDLLDAKSRVSTGIEEQRRTLETKTAGGISVAEYQNCQDYIKSLYLNLKKIEDDIASAHRAIEKKRAELTDIYKDKKTLEKMCDEQRAAFMKEEKAKEAKSIEDMLTAKMGSAGKTQESA